MQSELAEQSWVKKSIILCIPALEWTPVRCRLCAQPLLGLNEP